MDGETHPANAMLVDSSDDRFSFYAEANVEALVGRVAALVTSELDDEPVSLGSASTSAIIELLEPHQHQLVHDGWIQFGLVHQDDRSLAEVFIAPTKHFRVWGSDEKRFRSVLPDHAVPEMESLEFIDEYPRTTMRLQDDRLSFHDRSRLIDHLAEKLKALT